MPAAPLPLSGIRVLERADGVAAAYAGRMLAALGAETIMVEPAKGSALRREAPFLPGGASATFAYLAAGKRSVTHDPADTDRWDAYAGLLRSAAILIDDTPLGQRPGDDRAPRAINPGLVHVSVLPYGAAGPKAHWKGEEVNLVHACGEGGLLPNGLTLELFPNRPPLKIYGNFVSYHAGVAGAAGALAALLGGGGQLVDVSIQDVGVALAAMTVQRLGDGVLEHRVTRSFRYGGVFRCADGHIEVITAENHQWTSLVALLEHPEWARDPGFADELERGRRGAEINRHVATWAADKSAADVVARGQKIGVPIAKYRQPRDVLGGEHERSRGLFADVAIPGEGELPILVAPLELDGGALPAPSPPPRLGADQLLMSGAIAASQEGVA